MINLILFHLQLKVSWNEKRRREMETMRLFERGGVGRGAHMVWSQEVRRCAWMGRGGGGVRHWRQLRQVKWSGSQERGSEAAMVDAFLVLKLQLQYWLLLRLRL